MAETTLDGATVLERFRNQFDAKDGSDMSGFGSQFTNAQNALVGADSVVCIFPSEISRVGIVDTQELTAPDSTDMVSIDVKTAVVLQYGDITSKQITKHYYDYEVLHNVAQVVNKTVGGIVSELKSTNEYYSVYPCVYDTGVGYSIMVAPLANVSDSDIK